MRGGLRKHAMALGAMACGVAPAFAQTSPLIIDQNRIDRGQPPPAQHSPHDTLRGRIVVDETTPDTGVALREVRIVGSSLLASELYAATSGQLHRPIDQARILAVAEALTILYSRSDVALYSILAPAQSFENGVLRIDIVEGHISEVSIETDAVDAPDIRTIGALGERLIGERPLRRSTLERYLSLMRDTPGVHVDATLHPGADVGGVRLVIQARRNRADFGVSLSNRATPLLGETQISVDASFNGLLRGGDRITAMATAPIEDDLFRFFGLAYSTPLGLDGLTFSVNASSLRTTPDAVAIEGEATAGGVALSYPIVRAYDRALSVSLGLDALDTENTVLGQSVDTSRTRVLRFGLAFGDTEATRSRSLALSASFGLDTLGARADPLFADADFVKLAAQAAVNHSFGEHLALRLRFQLQASNDLLPASEQIALGGDGYGRAYPSGVVQGDYGAAASAEFVYAPPFAALPRTETYLFIDGGAVWLSERPFWAAYDFDLSSLGLGARFGIGDHVSLGMELTHGLIAPYAGAEEDWRVVYRLTSRN